MSRLIIANRHGHQVVEWDAGVDTEESRATIAEVERILAEARANGCRVSKKLGSQHVIDDEPFDPTVKEYQIIAPIAGG